MERQQNSALPPLIVDLFQQAPRTNFYRFCQYIEQLYPHLPPLGESDTPLADAVRFCPSPDMGFPAGEIKRVEWDENRPDCSPTVRTTFLGLYGVGATLPYAWLDDIVKQQEGHAVLQSFLDMFNHRIITQYYRVWRKYFYPAGFRNGGSDWVSQCLLALVGFGLPGAAEQIPSPPSHLLAFIGVMAQRARTQSGLRSVVSLLLPGVEIAIDEFYPQFIALPQLAQLSRKKRSGLQRCCVLGRRFKESNGTVNITITPGSRDQWERLLPGGEMHTHLLALLRIYLGYRVDACLHMQIDRSQLPKAYLGANDVRLGQTAIFSDKRRQTSPSFVTIRIGRYVGLTTDKLKKESQCDE